METSAYTYEFGPLRSARGQGALWPYRDLKGDRMTIEAGDACVNPLAIYVPNVPECYVLSDGVLPDGSRVYVHSGELLWQARLQTLDEVDRYISAALAAGESTELYLIRGNLVAAALRPTADQT